MPINHRAELKNIRTFPSLVRYLRDEMGWPIESDDFEEMTFEYTAEELGIDAASAAKIEKDGIKRLRPLAPNQPWGIFFVKFEPKRLPVVALRRILSRVALKKRVSANSDERAAWAADDLLFVSNYGEGDERQISFAHFSQDESKGDLPTLKVLGWDNLDTALHLDHVAELLTQRLAWPDDDKDVTRWRESWRSAFTLRHREVITTSKALAVRLAELARAIRNRIKTVLAIETKNGPVTRLMKAFQEALVHDLATDGFADMYAQTIAYGLLSARVTNPRANTADGFATQLPVTNPFLKELMETFLHVGGRKRKAGHGSGIDFDELGVSEVVELLDDANMEAVVRDFGDRNPQEDPVIHFYEDFIKQYDKSLWKGRGVIYTPRPVVSYIVRSVHELLQTEFGLADGLADTATWGEMAERHEGLVIPDGVKPTDRFVTILDVATGTGTFLVETIEVIRCTLTDRWTREGHGENKILDLWNEYVPRHLLPRLHGYELLMAPYAIAHLKIGLKLYETGYRFESDERARIYLTNTLEPAHDFSGQFEFMIPALAHEAEAVNAVKKHQRFTVVIGNPPYAINSQNKGEAIEALVREYYIVGGRPLKEKNPKGLLNDYVKFIGYATSVLDETGHGVLGFITDHSYLDGITFPGMRSHMLQRFHRLSLLDLHGDSKRRDRCPDGSEDKNVFDILEGVAIALLRKATIGAAREPKVTHADLWGPRVSPDGKGKYEWLLQNKWSSTKWLSVVPRSPWFLFAEQDGEYEDEYDLFTPLDQLFLLSSNGFKTHRDHFAIAYQEQQLQERIDILLDTGRSDEVVRKELDLGDTPDWSLCTARAELLKDSDWRCNLIPCLYRPFDYRVCLHSPIAMDRPRNDTLFHIREPNLCIATGRQGQVTGDEEWNLVFAGRAVADTNLFRRGGIQYFPMYLYSSHKGLFSTGSGAGSGSRTLNLVPSVLPGFASRMGMTAVFEGTGNLKTTVGPEDFVHFAYSILHSSTYRSRYADLLLRDYPRVPMSEGRAVFCELAHLGGELVALHLMESPKLDRFITTYMGPKNPEVGRVGWSDETVWLDAAATKKGQPATAGTIGFHGVSEEVWNFHIGGYQVCEKWLKDRKGRTLTSDDIAHYHRIVIALHETIRLMREIDEVIEAHGGWPAAFNAKTSVSESGVSVRRQIIALDDARVEHEKFKTLLPLYSLKAAAGYFAAGESVEPEGWVEVDGLGTLDERMFVARAIGRSMETTIHDGDLLVFRSNPVGTRQGKIVLAQYRGPADPDTGGSFTVKKYTSEKIPDPNTEWRHAKIVLIPENPEYTPIIIPSDSADDFRILAEFITILKPRDERST